MLRGSRKAAPGRRAPKVDLDFLRNIGLYKQAPRKYCQQMLSFFGIYSYKMAHLGSSTPSYLNVMMTQI
jgi:hypothetical protein